MFNDLIAAFTLFTRLPLWRLRSVPAGSFARAVTWWPATGLVTGALTAVVLWCGSMVFPAFASAVLACGARVFFTGAFHEDGLGDFFDGLGGGHTRERRLEIMKDSHTGSYAVLGLVLYFGLFISLISGLPSDLAVVVVFVGDPLSKALAGQLVNVLPYARRDEESKVGIRYDRVRFIALVVGVLPAATLLPRALWWAVVAPVMTFAVLVWLMKRRLGGYTGDCCGATFLLCEVSFYAGIWIVSM